MRSACRGFWGGLTRLSLSAALVLAGAASLAQTPSASSSKELLIPEEAARLTLNRSEISVAAAERIAKSCIDWARANNLLVSVFILSPSGNIVFAYRMDGENPIQVDTALRKAQTVLYMRTSTHAMIKRYGREMRDTMFDLGQFPFTGGLPILLNGQLIGAIGVGGAAPQNDEKCAHDAVSAVVGPQPPLTTD
jgi:glc operon protein GlcG